jgi:hypothetical protein
MRSSRETSKARTQKQEEWNASGAVDEFMSRLDHPLKPTVEAIRMTILGAAPGITEGIKWNSPNFYCGGWFATANARGKDSVMVVFHLGAKVKDNSTTGMSIDDNTGLLEWVAKERALAKFRSLEDFNAKKAAFQEVVSQWVKKMG